MADTIDNLSIEISAKADAAVQSLTRLQNAIKPLGGAGQAAAGGMKAMTSETEKADSTLQRVSKDASTAGKNVRNVGKDAEDAGKSAKKGTSGISSFWGALKRIAFYRFVRSVIREITDAFKTGITNLYHWSDALDGHFANAMDRLATSTLYLKNSLGAIVSPLLEAVIPVLDVVIDKVVDVLNFFNKLIATLSGADTYTVAKKTATAWDDSAKSTKKAVNDIKRTILGFDEINKLNGANNVSSSSNKTNIDYKSMFVEKPLTGAFAGFSNAIEKAMQDTLSRIGLLVSGAALAVGAILAFSGANLPLGLALMAAGAAGLVSIIGMNWDGLSADVKLVIGAIEAVVGGSLLAIGAVMAFSGAKVGLGIALMAAGAVTLAAAIGLNWDFLTGKVKVSAAGVATAVSSASLALGAVLAFTGVNPALGIALMAAGAVGISITAATLNWDYLKTKLQGICGEITAVISGALLMLGMVAIAGGRIPLGVGLIAAGSMGIAATVAARWDRLKTYLEGPIGELTGILSAASLVLGFVAIAGGFVPLGIGLIVAGSAGLATTVAARWDRLNSYLEGPIGTLTTFLSSASLVLGFVALAGGLIPLGIGLIVAGATGLAGTFAARWDRINEKIKDPINQAIAFISGASLVLGIIALVGGMIPLGIGLILAGAAGLATVGGENWQSLVDFGKTAIKKVQEGWNNAKEFVIDITVKIAGQVWDGVKSLFDMLVNPTKNEIGVGRSDLMKDKQYTIPLTDPDVTSTNGNGGVGRFTDVTVNAVPGFGMSKKNNAIVLNQVKGIASSVAIHPNCKPGMILWDDKIKPNVIDTSTVNTVNGEAGTGMISHYKTFAANVENTSTINTVNGKAGTGTTLSWDTFTAKVKDTMTKNTVNGVAGTGTTLSWDTFHAKVSNTTTTNTVNGVAGSGMLSMWGSFRANVSDSSTDVRANLVKTWWGNPVSALGLDNLKTTVTVTTKIAGALASVVGRAIGGIFSGGSWHDIPQYAGGTTNAHGTLFMAGEAGPEVVGHVGGRTEVLNKSQLAAAMYSAVHSAMQGVTLDANFYGGGSNNSEGGGMTVDINDGKIVTLLNEVRGLLMQINDKELSISTTAMNKAQAYMNRRAGATIVPLGT